MKVGVPMQPRSILALSRLAKFRALFERKLHPICAVCAHPKREHNIRIWKMCHVRGCACHTYVPWIR